MTIPREFEKFMIYGVLQCADSFLYIHTFLPIRYLLAIWAIIWRPIATIFGLRRRGQRFLAPAEICDLLKGTIWIASILILITVDTNRIYHIIKSQSVIKLYIFYNMLEVGDRLLSAFGQDTIDALFWTATEPKNRRRAHLGVVGHILFALFYVVLHSVLIMFQATALNVAINSNNKGLLGIMLSNNFVELKGSVFKKFDKNNLFQLSCSDVRERVHLAVLLFVVVVQTMKEFNWQSSQFFILLPDCCYVLLVEVLIDWIKHAFITRFNELPSDTYKEYTVSLAFDMTQTRQKHAFSDHSDLVARRMGFIPFPLGVVLIKALYTAISFDNYASIFLFIFAFITLSLIRVLNTIITLGQACNYMEIYQTEKSAAATAAAAAAQNLLANSTTISPNSNTGFTISSAGSTLLTNGLLANNHGGSNLSKTRPHSSSSATTANATTSTATTDTATSPIHSFVPIQRSHTIDAVPTTTEIKITQCNGETLTTTTNTSAMLNDQNLGATALFSNSDVDLDDICLNEKMLNLANDEVFIDELSMTRSVPDLQQESETSAKCDDSQAYRRTHKRSESEPSIQCVMLDGSVPIERT